MIEPTNKYANEDKTKERQHAANVEELLDTGFAEEVAEAQVTAPRQRLPAGYYRVMVLSAELAKARSEDPRSFQLKWVFIVTEGPHQGRRLGKQYYIQTATGVKIFKQEMLLLGIDTDLDVRVVLDALPHIQRVMLNVRLAYKPAEDNTGEEYPVVYLNERVADGIDIPAILSHIEARRSESAMAWPFPQ